MYNWNIDVKKLKKNKEEYTLWKLKQNINYGLNGDLLKRSDLVKYWGKIKAELDPYRARMIEFLLWKKKYSLPTNIGFWNWPARTSP